MEPAQDAVALLNHLREPGRPADRREDRLDRRDHDPGRHAVSRRVADRDHETPVGPGAEVVVVSADLARCRHRGGDVQAFDLGQQSREHRELQRAPLLEIPALARTFRLQQAGAQLVLVRRALLLDELAREELDLVQASLEAHAGAGEASRERERGHDGTDHHANDVEVVDAADRGQHAELDQHLKHQHDREHDHPEVKERRPFPRGRPAANLDPGDLAGHRSEVHAPDDCADGVREEVEDRRQAGRDDGERNPGPREGSVDLRVVGEEPEEDHGDGERSSDRVEDVRRHGTKVLSAPEVVKRRQRKDTHEQGIEEVLARPGEEPVQRQVQERDRGEQGHESAAQRGVPQDPPGPVQKRIVLRDQGEDETGREGAHRGCRARIRVAYREDVVGTGREDQPARTARSGRSPLSGAPLGAGPVDQRAVEIDIGRARGGDPQLERHPPQRLLDPKVPPEPAHAGPPARRQLPLPHERLDRLPAGVVERRVGPPRIVARVEPPRAREHDAIGVRDERFRIGRYRRRLLRHRGGGGAEQQE